MRAGFIGTVLDLRLWSALIVPLVISGCGSEQTASESQPDQPQASQAAPQIETVTSALLLPDGGVAQAPEGWTCSDESYYGQNGICDCGCGLPDPDCNGNTVDQCDTCAAAGSCGDAYTYYGSSYYGECPGFIDPWDITTCDESPGVVLYDQIGDPDGFAPTSQDFEASFSLSDSEATDDFHVPAGPSWSVERVRVLGIASNGTGLLDQMNVTFYEDVDGHPAEAVPGCSYYGVPVANTPSNVLIELPFACALAGDATYWVGVQARMDFTPNGQWFWESYAGPTLNGVAHWRNPGDGFSTGCTSFGPLPGCLPTDDTNLSFAVYGAQAPEGWTCDAGLHDDNDNVCDCGCGIPDPDCENSDADACDSCGEQGSCAELWGCQLLDQNNNWACNDPSGWTCNPAYFGDGPCDCGCGITDPDCDDNTVASCDYCDGDGEGSCTTTSCADIDPLDNSSCDGPGVPGGWTCDPSLYFNPGNSQCECGCGVVDPDCDDATANSCDDCTNEGSCAEESCGDINPGDNAVCGGAPGEWTCDPDYFGSDDGCDCGCGIPDPDCADETVASCDYCDGDGPGSCAVSCADISPNDNTNCDDGLGVPPAWNCDPGLYFNPGASGCECGCGEVDPDCNDATVFSCDSCTAEGSCAGESCEEIEDSENFTCGDVTDCTGQADGTPCADADNCTGGEVCNTGVCVQTVALCNVCDGGAGPDLAAGTPCGGQPGECSFQSTCDGFGACVPNFKPVEADCGGIVDPNGCVNQQKCDGVGACGYVGPVNKDVNTECGDQTNTECTHQDTCDGSGTCLANDEPPETDCNGLVEEFGCLNQDKCGSGPLAGTCVDNGFRPNQSSCGGDAGAVVSECDLANTCDPVGNCVRNHVAAGTTCGDQTDRACDNPDTCDGLGACQPNHEASATICRPDAGECDVAESCGDSITECPANDFEGFGVSCGDTSESTCDHADTCNGNGTCVDNFEPAATTVCRGDAGLCDVAELCDGNGACPADAFEAEFTPCDGQNQNTAIGPSSCDNPDTCDATGTCQPRYEPSTTVCRPAGLFADLACDVAENCDGAGSCPVDSFQPASTACGSSNNSDCDNPDSCNATGSCQANNELPTHVCRPDAGDCDVADTCGASTGACPTDVFEPALTACGDQTDRDCDNPDTCDSSGTCQARNEAPTHVCRADAGQCDVEETCGASTDACPANLFEANGVSCGSSTENTCDHQDTCNGSGTCQDNFEPAATTVCRAAGENVVAACDVAELCNGAGACPADGFAPALTACGDGTDRDCDNPDSCDSSGICQPRNEAPTFVCRSDAGDCDVAETCGASNTVCPGNSFEPALTACGDPTNRDCDNPDTCDSSGTCLPRNELPGFVCRGIGGGGANVECDVAETCGGSVTSCPTDLFKAVATACGDQSIPGGVDAPCSAPNSCDATGQCNPRNAPTTQDCGDTGTQCRNQDKCSGNGTCEDKGFVANGVSCGSGANTDCSNPDTCDGGGNCDPRNEGPTIDCNGLPGPCENQDKCDNFGGNCVDNAFKPLNAPCGDPSNTTCTDPDTCNATGVCLTNHASDGSDCGDSGTQCRNQDKCESGLCDDKGFVAAATPCGSGVDTVCSNPDSCDGSGTCSPNNESNSAVCRPAAGLCDVAELCNNGTCPGTDVKVAAAVECRPTAGNDCDIAEVCDGSSNACPADALKAAGAACGSAADTECNNPDTCNGSGACLVNIETPGTACGSNADTDCDNADTCDAVGACADNFEASTTSCREDTGECDVEEFCDGEGACPVDGFEPSTTACGSPTDTECDNPDHCSGTSTACLPDLEIPGTSCGDATDRECDNPDSCDGSGGCLPRNELPTFVCRGADGVCDVAETCGASAAACPPDAVQPNATPCGSASDTVCDNADSCNGVAKSCQANNEPTTTTCGDAETECTNQDFCSGTGTCAEFGHKVSGTLCGSPSDTVCDNADTCNGAGTCLANNEPPTTNCGDAGTECTNQDKCSGSGACTDNGYKPDGSFCGSSNDTQCDNRDTCNGAGTCQVNNEPNTTNCGDTGTECTNQDKCSGSGTCTDNGFQPALTACGDPTNRDCDNPDSCNGSGTCLNRNEASGFVCRSSAGACDVEETCGLSTTACPPDVLRPNAFACGSSTDSDCDNPDTCNGVSVTCQVNNEPNTTNCGDTGTECTNQDKCDGSGTCFDNGYQISGTSCGSSTDTDCNNPDSCDGSGGCLPNFVAASTACGSSSDTDCDNADTCDGSGGCQLNHEVSGFSCRPSVDDCDVAETCDGTGAACPTDALATAGTECRTSAGACDVAETCDGVTDSCPTTDDVEVEGTECRGAAGACDVVETCDGSGVACPADVIATAGEVCRAADGECDVAETCNGSVVTCPTNGFEESGTACGNATDTDCDDPDTCNATGTCRSNVEPAGTACGDDSSNDCTSPDTCNGSGTCNLNNATNGTSCEDDGTCSVGICQLPEVDAGSDAGSDAGGDDAGATAGSGGQGGRGGEAGTSGNGDDAGPGGAGGAAGFAGGGGFAGFPDIFLPDGGLVPDAGAIVQEFVDESGVCDCTLPGNTNGSSTGKAAGWALLTLFGLAAVRRRRAA